MKTQQAEADKYGINSKLVNKIHNDEVSSKAPLEL
jgi:hypothetical protein